MAYFIIDGDYYYIENVEHPSSDNDCSEAWFDVEELFFLHNNRGNCCLLVWENGSYDLRTMAGMSIHSGQFKELAREGV